MTMADSMPARPISSSVTPRAARRASVFITYNGVLDPLGPSQMLSYLDGAVPLVRGLAFGKTGEFAQLGQAAIHVDAVGGDVVDAWMKSPTHRANIMNGNYTEIGVGTAKGTYKGTPTVFVVQFFGTPKNISGVPDLVSATPNLLLVVTILIFDSPKTKIGIAKIFFGVAAFKIEAADLVFILLKNIKGVA